RSGCRVGGRRVLRTVARRAGHDGRVTGVGGERVRVAAAVAAATATADREARVAVTVLVRLLVLLRHLAQARRNLVPGGAGEDRGRERLDAQPHELVLGVGVPDVGRPGAAETARDA